MLHRTGGCKPHFDAHRFCLDLHKATRQMVQQQTVYHSIKIILHSITPKNEEGWVGDIVFVEYLGKSFLQLHHVYLESFKKSRRACDEAPACRRPSHNSLISGW